MNWKDVPHLFKGFEFINHTHIPDLRMKLFSGNDLWLYEKMNGGLRNHRKKDCTLIARKIEDMTDEELKECQKMGLSSVYPSTILRKLLEQVDSGEMLAVNERYLLSIGVYPFDQSHFGDTVIDIKTLEESR